MKLIKINIISLLQIADKISMVRIDRRFFEEPLHKMKFQNHLLKMLFR